MSSARRGPAGKSGKRPSSHAKGSAGKGGGSGRASKGSAPKNFGGKNAGKTSGTTGSAGKKNGASKGARNSSVVFDLPPVPIRTEPFRLGLVAGATPGKWIRIWRDRYPDIEVELVTIDSASARTALLAGDIDAAIVREPFSPDDLHAIALYDEVVGAVVSVDSALEAAAELTLDDLAGEVLIVPRDDAAHFGPVAGTIAPLFDAPASTEDAIETVASGVGIVIVPMSIARAHQRKDVTFRPIVGAAPTQVKLAWDRTNDSAEVQAFVGIVRGRTAQSSRG